MSILIKSLQKTQHKTIKIIKNGAGMTLEMNKNVNGKGNGWLWKYIAGIQWSFYVLNVLMRNKIRICVKEG